VSTYQKDSADILDYAYDFGPYLTALGDTIVSATVTATTGITLAPTGHPTTNTTTTVIAWLAGGTLGEKYAVTFHIVTAAGRELDRTIRIHIVER
jgi:hypothetical protein